MRTWKWIAGMLSILFSFLVMLQSALSGVFNLITQNGEMSGTAGLLVAILMMAGGIMSFLSRNENKNQRNLYLAIILVSPRIWESLMPGIIRIYTFGQPGVF